MLSHNLESRLVNYPYARLPQALSASERDEVLGIASTLTLGHGHVLDVSQNSDDVHMPNTRRSKVGWVEFTERTSWLFERVSNILEVLNFNYFGYELWGFNRIQYAEYHAAEQGTYHWHMDLLHNATDMHRGLSRKLSMTIALNDNFEGGEFEIALGDTSQSMPISLSAGDAIVFPSFIVHRVAPMTRGCRKSLVVWGVGPKFR